MYKQFPEQQHTDKLYVCYPTAFMSPEVFKVVVCVLCYVYNNNELIRTSYLILSGCPIDGCGQYSSFSDLDTR